LPNDIVLIGKQYPSAIFLPEGNPIPNSLQPESLNLTKCNNKKCGLVQLANEYDLDYVFKHYPYQSSLTASMSNILCDVAADGCSMVGLSEGDVVLDIGGNDGTLLSYVRGRSLTRVNMDAASNIKQVVSDLDYIHVESHFSADAYHTLDLPNPKLIFSVAMFYHLNNPVKFCQDVYEIMSDDSLWVIQLTWLGRMLPDNIFDNIVHEHAAYYSLFSLEALLRRVGLHIIEARIIKSYGGSLRVFVAKNPSGERRNDYHKVCQFEAVNQTNTFEALRSFGSRIELLRRSLRDVIEHIVLCHGPMWAFGASTKGNMLLQYLRVDEKQISCILDNSPKKIGKRTIGSSIPIVDESSNLGSWPKYVMVLPYYYTDVFVPIIRVHLPTGQETHLLIPLPHPHFFTLANRGIHY
jgi:NDP-4-keto-2,6-dideoxyhexose 3-C-methyltransferase